MKNYDRVKNQYIIPVIVSVIIVFIVASKIFIINFSNRVDGYLAKEGIMDLQNWKPDRGNTKLNGVWEFYPGVFLEPNKTSTGVSEKLDGIKKYINVPGTWDNYINEAGSAEGAGTYRLIVKVPEDRLYAIKTKTIRFANRIYLNGQKVIHTGEPSLSRAGFKPESKYKIGAGSSLDGEIEVIAHVSSFGYKTGGIIAPIEFGSFKSIMFENNVSRAFDTLAVSICLVLGVYFFIIYFQRKRGTYLLCFSIMNFAMALYLAVMNEQILDLAYNYDFQTRTGIQITGMMLTTVCLLRFTHHFFIDFSNKRAVGITTIINLSLLFLSPNNLEKLSPLTATALQGILIIGCTISYAYVAYILLKAIYNRADSLEYVLVITTSLFAYWFVNALKMILEIDVGNIPAILIFIMLFSAAALIGHRLRLDYRRANSLSEKLIRYDRLKDEFLAKASHELKTPLHMILNLTKNLFEGQKGTLNFKQQEDLFFVYREGQRLTRLVEDLLDAAQIKGGNLKLRLDSIKPYRMLEYILEEMEVLIPEEKNIVLKNRVSEEFPALRADPDKFTQIIYNLVHNAIKYTENGEIKICASIIDDQAEIEVSDTGIGIEEKHLEEIFNTFYQENDKGEPNQGLGLGLSIVKHLVESQGGQIKAESAYGEGTTFKFTLPISQSNMDNQNEVPEIAVTKEFYTMPKQVSAESLDQPGILVVDDEPLNQKILTDILEPLKYHVFLANGGAETLEILKHNKIDLILLDYMLPDMKGDQVCREIRKIYSITELPILILTASGRTIDLMNGFEYGANDFQRKPLDVKELVPRIQSLLLMKKTVEVGLEKEFQYFYSQISPHFLYNTINTIIGLSYKDSEKARRALNNLSIYFRGKLDIHRYKGVTSLESELELVTAYLEIEQMRYGERLNVLYDLDENLRAVIPPLTLQPIVENSIRHGIMAGNGKGTIKISTRKGSAGFVNVTIEDDGAGMTPAKQRELLEGNSQRVGFKNVANKIKILKGANLILKSKTGEGTKVEIIIPEVKQDESYVGG